MAENKINVGGRLHSIATGNVLAGANEIFDDEKNKKQSQINTETYSLVEEINAKLNTLSPNQQAALDVAGKANNNEAKLGYYICDTEGNSAAKVIPNITGYVLSVGGSMKVKMTNANTADNATLNINSTGAKALYYDGKRASATNSWKAGETVEVYYDGTSYYANSVAGGTVTSARIKDGAVTINKLEPSIQSLITNINKNASFAGIATPTTNPGTPDGPVFYIAFKPGVYSNFGDIEVTDYEVVILHYDTTWHKITTGIGSKDKVAELESDFNLLPIEKIKLQDGKYLVGNDLEISSSSYGITDYLSVAEGMVVSCANFVHSDTPVIGLYDDNKVIRGSVSLSAADDEVVFVVPTKIRFIRASYLVASKSKFYIHTDFPSSTRYIGDKIDKLIELPISLDMNGYISSGGTFSTNINWKSSDFVDINFGYTLECTYYLTHSTCICIYDKDKKLIASFPGTEGVKKTTITINPNDYPTLKYLRVCSILDPKKVDYSTKVKSVFGIIPNDSVKASNLQDESVSERKTTFFTHDGTSNFIDRRELLQNTFINDGTEHSKSGWYATGKVKLLPNTTYYYGNLYPGYYAFYKSDGTLIEYKNQGNFLTKPFTTPAETAYGRFSMQESSSSSCWIALANAMPADYKLIIPSTHLGEIQLPDESITTPKIAEKAVTPAKLSFFIHDPNTDFIKQNNWIANKLITEQGQESSQSGYWATGFVPLSSNTTYYKNTLWFGYYAFYDADKNLIEGHGNDSSLISPFTTPVGTAYGRFTCTNTDNKNNAWIGLVNNPAPYAETIDPQYIPALQKKYCDYEGNEFSMFNKCICVGDSLTEGVFNENGSGAEKYVGFKKYSYPTFLSKLTGVEVNNLGNGGDTSAEWYDRHKEDNLSGHDVAIIQLGTNDAARYSGWTETSITGFTNIINKLKNENNNIKIFVSTISKRFGDPSAEGKAVISEGIRQLVLSLADPNVILLDMEEYAHTGDEQAYECGHYSAYGYWRLAQDYKNIIGYYINSHKNLFRTVQFIGTNYSYSD